MSSISGEQFSFSPAKRERVPLLVGLVGCSGSGKTYSALRLASGIQRVTGGDIFVVDTEARRSLHYADQFTFRHADFGPPFSPSRYAAIVEAAIKAGAKTLVIDSTSHLHEGKGGVLEMHEAELDRMAGSDWGKRDRMNFAAWIKPKQELTKFVQLMLQLPINLVFCFRAKEKLKIIPNKPPQPLGWMPIASPELAYEMTVNILLPPNSRGVPQWQPEDAGEKAIIKLPAQFDGFLRAGGPLSEDIGAKLAEWAAGGAKPSPTAVPAITISGVSKSEKDGKTVYLVTSSAGTYATMDDALAAVASSLVGKPARVSATQTAKGGWKLTAIEPVEEAA